MNLLNNIKKKLIYQFKAYYSFVIVPNNNKKYFQLRIRKLYLHILIILILVIGTYSVCLTVISNRINTDISTNVEEIEDLSSQDQQQKEYITELEVQLEVMSEKITELENLETYIKDITDYEEEEETTDN